MILVAVGIILNISSVTAKEVGIRASSTRPAMFNRSGKSWHSSGLNLVSVKTKKAKSWLKEKKKLKL